MCYCYSVFKQQIRKVKVFYKLDTSVACITTTFIVTKNKNKFFTYILSNYLQV